MQGHGCRVNSCSVKREVTWILLHDCMMDLHQAGVNNHKTPRRVRLAKAKGATIGEDSRQ
jgi:hypothetical protein